MENTHNEIQSASINSIKINGAIKKIIAAQRTIPVNIINLCEEFDDVSVVKSPEMPKSISGAIIKKDGRYSIYCNDKEPITRQRFTIAHELAHYLLHQGKFKDSYPENILLRGGLENMDEIDANKLAASILMPFGAINSYVDTMGVDFRIKDMANHFGVSVYAMAVRLGIPLDI